MNQSVVVGLSGGVDSAVTAALLQQQGYQVVGVFMDQMGKVNELADAQKVAAQLHIPLHRLDYQAIFQEKVIDRYRREQAAGKTPSPCCWCNPHVKFAALLQFADAHGIDWVATGHYARVQDGQLFTGADPHKDQAYFLSGLQPAQLKRLIFPLGNQTKAQTRALAMQLKLPVAVKPDSNDMCFAVDNHPLTIGQRVKQGGQPTKMYYLGDGKVGPADAPELYRQSLTIKDFNLLAPFTATEPLTAKVRSTQTPVACTATLTGTQVIVNFLTPVRAVTPGQWCVLYRGTQVLGGGEIQ